MRTYKTKSIRSTFSALMILIAILLFSISAAIAQSETKITADDAAANDVFSFTVSISGDYAVVGAQNDDDDGEDAGSAYIFFRDGADWTQQAKLTAGDAAEGDKFGISVSINGDYVVIGAYHDDDEGSAYIFVREGADWNQQVKLKADDAVEGDGFGRSVSINGDYAVVGAECDDDGGEWSGSAYIFVRDGADWTQQAKLTADDAAAYDHFGFSVSISGDYAIVGACGHGSAYIFVRDGADWTQQVKLTADDASGGSFGLSVSISGDYAVVGAFCHGSAYIFVRDGADWTQQAKLTADDAAEWDMFGHSVSISGDYAVVGAFCDDDGGEWSGSAYIFVRDGADWTEHAKLTADDAAEADWFGYSVSISGDYAVIGAPMDDDGGESSGSAYIYNLGENNIK